MINLVRVKKSDIERLIQEYSEDKLTKFWSPYTIINGKEMHKPYTFKETGTDDAA